MQMILALLSHQLHENLQQLLEKSQSDELRQQSESAKCLSMDLNLVRLMEVHGDTMLLRDLKLLKNEQTNIKLIITEKITILYIPIILLS